MMPARNTPRRQSPRYGIKDATTTPRRQTANDANTGPAPRPPDYKREPFATHSDITHNTRLGLGAGCSVTRLALPRLWICVANTDAVHTFRRGTICHCQYWSQVGIAGVSMSLCVFRLRRACRTRARRLGPARLRTRALTPCDSQWIAFARNTSRFYM